MAAIFESAHAGRRSRLLGHSGTCASVGFNHCQSSHFLWMSSLVEEDIILSPYGDSWVLRESERWNSNENHARYYGWNSARTFTVAFGHLQNRVGLLARSNVCQHIIFVGMNNGYALTLNLATVAQNYTWDWINVQLMMMSARWSTSHCCPMHFFVKSVLTGWQFQDATHTKQPTQAMGKMTH